MVAMTATPAPDLASRGPTNEQPAPPDSPAVEPGFDAPPVPLTPAAPGASPLPAEPATPAFAPLPLPLLLVAPPLLTVPPLPVTPPAPVVPPPPVAPPEPGAPPLPFASPLPPFPAEPLAPPLPFAPVLPVLPAAPTVPPRPATAAPPAIPPPLLGPPPAPAFPAEPLRPPPAPPPMPVSEPSGTNVKSRKTISTGCPSDGGESKHQRFIPRGRACCGMFTVGFDGMYAHVRMRLSFLPTACRPASSELVMLVLVHEKRDVESVAPPSENVYDSSPIVFPDAG